MFNIKILTIIKLLSTLLSRVQLWILVIKLLLLLVFIWHCLHSAPGGHLECNRGVPRVQPQLHESPHGGASEDPRDPPRLSLPLPQQQTFH